MSELTQVHTLSAHLSDEVELWIGIAGDVRERTLFVKYVTLM
jgi:hypothetical protein